MTELSTSLATQNADAVAITGGTVANTTQTGTTQTGGTLDNCVIGGTTPAAGTFTTASVAAGTSSSNVKATGVLSVNTTSTGNTADTTEDVLLTFSLPAKSLAVNGQGVRITAWGNTAANTDNKTIRLYFGSEVIASPTAATNNKGWWMTLEAYRTGASTQVVFGLGQVDTTAVTPLITTGAETDTSAITIKVTGQAGTGNANDIVAKGLIVEMLN